ncbi:hypothetical protein BISA_0866 [Bifidobacterium saguini DSM 23967]|uniref:Single-stranded DNA-binding protein n=2 Tax=Bifidobacterium saguini TaxID=762210 RepID=A0A087DAB5_9BIFI|nr:hypothetical protein [Bifidobacterium saguini]KFI92465.1 hypothetical protein BISA_0866 [Bifidobacterium saguini DSM 23967]QTB90810.1 hypothetical protein BSD967_11085 [Bifidobacterium saguini]QTB90872.1 hypothetical protein BSD967_11420 [Bifidobacterium saguini]
MAGRTMIIIQGTAWGVQETSNGKRYLRVSVTPGYRDRNGQWVSQPEQSYSVWPAGYANLNPVFDQISQLRADQSNIVEVTVVGEVNAFHGYQNKQGQLAASCNVNASAIAVTNVRQKGGQQQRGGFNANPPQGYAQQSQQPASDPWASPTQEPEF